MTSRTGATTTASVTQTRRAFLWASAGRYVVMGVNLISTLALARLLTPADYGVSVLGGLLLAIAESIRALGGGAYLIQKQVLRPQDVQCTFTVSLAATLGCMAAVLLLCVPLLRHFDMPDLASYLPVAALGYACGAFVYPVMALMSRDLAFQAIARIAVVSALVNAAVSVWMAASGFGYMSLAWAGAVSAGIGLVLFLAAWRDMSIFRPRLRGCLDVVAFGAYDGATSLLMQIGVSVPYFIIDRLLDNAAAGLAQRALALSMFPERVILAGVGAVALPAFSVQMRASGQLKEHYLLAVELVTAALWPALLVLALLARPVVAVLLGRQWLQVAPLIQILCTALLFSFPACLHYPTLVAAGQIRKMPAVVVAQSTISSLVLYAAAWHGLLAVAWSMLLVVPLNGLIALLLARFVVGFDWGELGRAIMKSLICSAASAAGPAVVVLLGDPHAVMPFGLTLLAGGLAIGGWLSSLMLIRHPLASEMLVLGRAVGQKLEKRRSLPF